MTIQQISLLHCSRKASGIENVSVLQPENMLFPQQGSMGKTYLYKGFKAMMSRIVLTISAVSAYKHNKNLSSKEGKRIGKISVQLWHSPDLSHLLQWFLVLGQFLLTGKATGPTGWLSACAELNWLLARRYDQIEHSSHLRANTQFDRGHHTDLSTAQPLHSATFWSHQF